MDRWKREARFQLSFSGENAARSIIPRIRILRGREILNFVREIIRWNNYVIPENCQRIRVSFQFIRWQPDTLYLIHRRNGTTNRVEHTEWRACFHFDLLEKGILLLAELIFWLLRGCVHGVCSGSGKLIFNVEKPLFEVFSVVARCHIFLYSNVYSSTLGHLLHEYTYPRIRGSPRHVSTITVTTTYL